MWLWITGGLLAWAAVAVVLGVVIGRGIRLADQRAGLSTEPLLPARSLTAARTPRRALPLPTAGVVLAAVAVLLETAGFLLRITHARGPLLRALSMDAPLSLPRLYVAALFGLAAAAALVGAGRMPRRRTWWTAVGVVAGLIAAVKAGGTIHAAALRALESAVGETAADVLSVLLAGAVVAALWWLSRTERRDRRRVLGALALYALAAVVLSAVSSHVAAHSGFTATAVATYVEESGEALSAVAFLVGVLAGVAPRLVLPAGWPLRRAADAATFEVAAPLPRPRAASGDAGR
jgi:hypothetical protein